MPGPVGGKDAVGTQRDKDPVKTGVQQRLRRFLEAGIVSDLHAGEQFCFDAVGLQGVQLAQHRLQLHCFGSGYRVGK